MMKTVFATVCIITFHGFILCTGYLAIGSCTLNFLRTAINKSMYEPACQYN